MLIAPSLLSCDFSRMGEEIKRMDFARADFMHLDVMDGHFVPNLTFGAPVIKTMRKYTDIPFDAHLMISDPFRYVEDFASAGADIISFHFESDSDVMETIRKIKENEVKAGLAIKPKTPAEAVFSYLDHLQMVVVMTVEPGFGGQSFIIEMLPKITKLKKEIRRRGLNVLIEVDGGVTPANIAAAAKAGADVCVAGTAVFSAPDAKKAIEGLKAAVESLDGK